MKINPNVPTRVSCWLSEIHTLHSENINVVRPTFDRAIRIGELLTQIKSELKHAEWLPCLEANVKFSQRTADSYMWIFNEREQLKLITISNLTNAYKQLAEPVPPWAKEAYPAIEALEASLICEITAFIMARRGVLVPAEELTELYFLLREGGIRYCNGMCEQFDGKKWQCFALLPSYLEAHNDEGEKTESV